MGSEREGGSTAATASATSSGKEAKAKAQKAFEIRAFTIRDPPYSYAQLELIRSDDHRPGQNGPVTTLDALQVKSYCTAALGRYLGQVGQAIPLDILKVEGARCWLRVPRPNLTAFAAAVSAWPGTREDGSGAAVVRLRVVQCSDWLGSMVGSDAQDELWT